MQNKCNKRHFYKNSSSLHRPADNRSDHTAGPQSQRLSPGVVFVSLFCCLVLLCCRVVAFVCVPGGCRGGGSSMLIRRPWLPD